ncbi:leucine carboxyl methyltransferase, partial [Nadsonia fulvescens var. elongata DSM 6958]
RQNKVIQSTDLDALSSKYSCVKKGYLDDEYIDTIVAGLKAGLTGNSNSSGVSSQFDKGKKSPIINRGTYIRHNAMDQLVEGFLKTTETVLQIISLGSGSDTRPFKLLSDSRFNNVDSKLKVQKLVYHEIDFEESSRKKASTIKNDEKLSKIIGLNQNSQIANTKDYETHTDNYHLYGFDLRSISADTQIGDILPFVVTSGSIEDGISVQTLIISECCLCYLEPKKNSEILNFFSNNFHSSNLGIILYEPMGSNDNFGSVMVENLASRGISLPTLMKYRTIEDQLERFKQLQFKSVWVSNVEEIWYNWISDDTMSKIKKLEFLDEVEEFNLLLNHYCFVW